jgi:predicted PurR-regulated permease PerM
MKPEHDAHASEPASAVPTKRAGSSVAMTILAALAILFSAYHARAILMPIVMGCILTLLLRPVIRQLNRYRIPKPVGAATVLAGLILVVGGIAAYLAIPARDWIQNMPAYLEVIGERLGFIREAYRELDEISDKIQDATIGDGNEASSADDVEPPPEHVEGSQTTNLDEERPIRVETREPKFVDGLTILGTTGGLLAGAGMVLALTFFLLATGDRLLNNALHLTPRFSKHRKIVAMVYRVEHEISSYLLTITLINASLGVGVGTAMWILGVPTPALWGVMAAFLNFVPYLGGLVGGTILLFVGMLSFDSLLYAILPVLVYSTLNSLEASLVTPFLLGRRMRLNPTFVFLSLVFWAWLWGIGGALVAVPILAITKSGLDQFERTRLFGELLGA